MISGQLGPFEVRGMTHCCVNSERVRVFIATASPVEDLPSDPVVEPAEFPDWGEQVMAPGPANCDSVEEPLLRYASTTA